MRTKLLLIIVTALFLVPVVHGATLHGTIYDLDLNEVFDAVVEVDTNPLQRMVARDGAYSFSLPEGTYKITAKYSGNFTEIGTVESVTVKTDGDYVFDLFLLPDFVEEQEIISDVDMSIGEEDYFRDQGSSQWIYVLLVTIVISVFGLLWYATQHGDHEDELDEDIDRVISVMKKHGGRTTQKELRKELPLSEAKVSLLVSELESKEKIKKIKKGRGNILVLNK